MDPNHFDGNNRPGRPVPSAPPVAHSQSSAKRYRIPTIDEAFPYTPLASIIPFDAAVIPAPHIAPSSTKLPPLLSPEQQSAANVLFQSLNREAEKAERASTQLQETLSDFQTLLKPAGLTKIKFKSNHRIPAQPPAATPSASNGDTHRLGAFAKMAFDRTTFVGRYPSPVSPDSSSGTRPKSATKKTMSVVLPAKSSQSYTNGNHDDSHTNYETPSSSQKLQTVVLKTMTPDERSNFVNLTDQNLAPAVDIRREQALVSPSRIDLKKKAQAALEALQTLLSDIAEAESANNEAILQFRETEDGPVNVLQPDVQKHLDKLLLSVCAHNSAPLLSLDSVLDIQKLCSNTMRSTTSLGLLIGQSWDEQAVQEWVANLQFMDQALIASRTILRTMTAGHDDKQIVSEELLRTMLELITKVTDTCIVPIVELRFDAENDSHFQIAKSAKQSLVSLFASFNKAMVLVGTLLHETDIDETVATTVASLCKRLVFVENAPAEKDSVLGIQVFEKTRKAGMDVLAKIFSRNKDQGRVIFVDVLTSLEHLPVTRQSARQYRLPDAKPIQLVSALLMRLVQSSATRSSSDPDEVHTAKAHAADDDSEPEDDGYDSDASEQLRRKRQTHKPQDPQSLDSVLTPLLNAASWDALYAVRYLLDRALKSSKSSDEPYRNLLDIFVEDFVSVLGRPEWPAAELFLRHMTTKLYEITEGKASAPAKTMALELLGVTTSSILDLRMQVRKSVESLHAQERETALDYELYAADDVKDRNLLAVTGPYRMVLEYLRLRSSDNDAHAATACGFHVAQWADRVLTSQDGSFDPQFIQPEDYEALKDRLTIALTQGGSIVFDADDIGVSTEEAKICSALVTLRSPYCSWFNTVLSKLLASMSSDQPSLRSKALKTVDQVLEKDPSLLDRSNIVLGNIIKCLGDSSPQVKDSALGLLNKCLLLRPQLEANIYTHIAALAGDPAIGVKKRAMKMLKELYLRNDDLQMRSTLASALVLRIGDDEESIRELAKQMLEDIWIAPLYGVTNADADQASRLKMQVRQQASMLIGTVQQGRKIVPVLQDLLVEMMSPSTKGAKLNTAVCRQLVLAMVDAIVSENELPGGHSRDLVMQMLSIFAQAKPQLFTSVELQPLLPYLKNIQVTDNAAMYRCTIIILRHTLPHMKNLPAALLEDTQSTLLSSTSKLPAAELKEVTTCLWTLTELLNNRAKLLPITRSALEKLAAGTQSAAKQQANMAVIKKLALLVGHFVSTFDLDEQVDLLKAKFPNFKGKSLVDLSLSIICPLVKSPWLMEIRLGALASMCRICNSHPRQYLDKVVCATVQSVFDGREPALEKAALEGLLDFFTQGADKKPIKTEPVKRAQDMQAGTERITSTYVATDRDGASTSLAQRFFEDIKRLALASTGELALLAAKVIAAINQSGLMHPRDSAPCLVALETSPVAEIADIAYEQHKSLFLRHETMFEKENMRAVQQAYLYQRDVIGNKLGYIGPPAGAKLRLFWDVINTAAAKVRKRFLTTISTKLDFDPTKLELTPDSCDHLDFVRFCCENVALFDYIKAEDLMALVTGLERIVSATGATFAHDIDALAPTKRVEDVTTDGAMNIDAQPELAVASLDEAELRRLSISSAILTIVWETRNYVYKVWNLVKHANVGKTRNGEDKTVSDKGRAPQRIPNAQNLTERFLARNQEMMAALNSRDGQYGICQAFQQIMSIDEDVQVPAGDDDDMVGYRDGETTPGPEGFNHNSRSPSVAPNGRVGGTPSKRGRKRKSGADSTSGTPHKKRAAGQGSTGAAKKRRSSQYDEDDADDDFTG